MRPTRALVALVVFVVAGCAGETTKTTPALDAPVLLSMDGEAGADLWLVDVATGRMENLTKSPDDEYNASWSPDGKRIVFVRQYSSGAAIGGDDLFVLDVPSRRVRPLRVTEFEEGYPAWSPDGRRIAFVSDHEFVLGAIYTVRPDGRDLRLVGARGRMPESLTWSPDGRRLAFVTNVGPGDDLRVHVIDADGGVAVPLSAGEIDREPVWSPRGEEIVFVRGFEIRAVDVASGDERSLGVTGLLAGWYDENGTVAVVELKTLALVTRDGERREIAPIRGLVYAPPAPRP